MSELNVNHVKYSIDFSDIKAIDGEEYLLGYEDVYKDIKRALEIDKEGFNIFLIDDFSKDKLNKMIRYIEDNLPDSPPKDVCYFIGTESRNPKGIFLSNGQGRIFKKYLEEIQKNYSEKIYDFYNTSDNKEKEKLLEKVQKNRSELIGEMVKVAEESGFDIKFTGGGFTFIPIKEDGNAMSEKEYESLEKENKDDIIKKVFKLKEKAQNILDKIKDSEEEGIENIKELMEEYLEECSCQIKEDFKKGLDGEECAIKCLVDVCSKVEKALVDNYSMSYEEDEEEIGEIIYKYGINVIVDNSNNKKPICIYEDDPNLSNLLGNIEYENKNGVYVTDISLIKAGSMLKANEGCLILRMNNLLANTSSYYYLKKALVNGKVDIDYNKGYLELLSLSGIHPEPIKINAKVILIGDYEVYDILYNHDEDFKKIFKMKAQYNPYIKIDDKAKISLLKTIDTICKENNISPLEDEGKKEIAKYLSRKAESKDKLYFNIEEIERVILLANNQAINEKAQCIGKSHIIKIAYDEDMIEKEILEAFEEKKLMINVNERLVGEINGLTVLDAGYFSFGKPVRITCSCYNGDGNIVDVQKDSQLSGKIHSKAINILKGFINNLIGGYNKIPVDFHLSFEQVYGKVDGDSASVAEIIAMLSSLSKIGIKNNIAITGSMNQKGEVQPIGGVNEKIEGFFKVCKKLDSVKDKGVIIPYSNINNLVLNKEVEEEIEKGNFKIYTMKTIEDAINILMCDEDIDYKYIMDCIEKELKKYVKKVK
ncbi:AAA family ATPase [uncultured Clostridium sp.]|uniref:AAA family ATPase n=1 Tax=uncultured Clostridium sp. TaxID=59620 RepID=UPI0028F00AF6|nr:AAA family ATPase [uncultured Clostridium sp.]